MPTIAHGLRAGLVVLALGMTASAHQGEKNLCEGFLPPNDMQISVQDAQAHKSRFEALIGFRAAGGITEAQFNKVLDRMEKIYTPIVKAHGGVYQINRKWTDPTVNAYAQQFGTS